MLCELLLDLTMRLMDLVMGFSEPAAQQIGEIAEYILMELIGCC